VAIIGQGCDILLTSCAVRAHNYPLIDRIMRIQSNLNASNFGPTPGVPKLTN
jgi:hypothetical protein